MKKIIILTICIITSFSMFADENEFEKMFVDANNLYSANKYTEATDAYLKIIEKGYESANLYYNLGNSYFKTKKIAQSILYYEKAKLLAPSNDKIQHNLDFANQFVIDKIETVPAFFVTDFFNNIITSKRVDTWAIISLVAFILSLSLLLVVFFNRILIIRRLGLLVSTLLIFISLTSFVFANDMKNITVNDNYGIITTLVTVKSSPDASSTDLFILNEGLKVEIQDNLNNWLEIKLSDGRVGWIEKDNLGVI